MGGGQGSTMISATHVRTPEFTPRGVPILDPSYLRVSNFGVGNLQCKGLIGGGEKQTKETVSSENKRKEFPTNIAENT